MYSEASKGISLVLSVVSLILSATLYVNYGEAVATAAVSLPIIAEESTDYAAQEVGFIFSKAQTETDVQESAKSDTKTQEKTSKNEKKQGKITSQYLTPYNANTSYNNIYVNNQSGEKINIKKLISGYSSGVEIKSKEPQVLIMHTHATENYVRHDGDCYFKSDLQRTSNENFSVLGVGEKLKETLENGGISVLHDKTLHDSPSYSGSYNRSAVTVQNYLKKYPSIKVVLDVHRDAFGGEKELIKPVKEIDGKTAAQVMVCIGSETGIVDDFPNWRENLKLGLKLQQTMEVMYPGLARALYLSYEHTYNQNLFEGSIIIEFGTNGNSFSEAKYSAELVGKALVTLFKNQ